jgi:predicted tellurium resistance membrane protein TerC
MDWIAKPEIWIALATLTGLEIVLGIDNVVFISILAGTLALSFLLLIGVALIAEGFDQHIPKGYIYFAMAFSLGVEMLNLRLRRGSTPVKLHESVVSEGESGRT